MTADLRGFAYALEPVRRKREWELDASRARLGRVQHELERATRAREALGAQLEAGQEAVRRRLAGKVDPAAHARALEWLAGARAAVARADAGVRALERERATARAECIDRQRRLEVIDRHREACLGEHLSLQEARRATEADRDWLARLGREAEPAPHRRGGAR